MGCPLDDAPFFSFLEFETPDGSGPEIPLSSGFDALRQTVSELRAQSPLVRNEIGVTVLARDEVHTALGDKRLRSGIAEVVALQGASDDPIGAGLADSVLASEGERHIRLRRLATRALTPRAVEQVRPKIAELANELIDAMVASGTDGNEFMAEFADKLPVWVICHVLGVPVEDRGQFAQWNHAITWVLSAELVAHREEIEWGLTNLHAYVVDLIEQRRANPGDDLVSSLVLAHSDDDQLASGDVEHMITSLLFAGHDTTRNQLGLGMWLFAHHPEQWRHLRDDATLVNQAVEEVLRFRGTAGSVPRFATEEVELGGYTIPAGTFVALSLNHANADPAVYDNPLDFDVTIERETINSFGGGRHYCLGANLARAELQEAFRALSQRFETVTLAGDATWRPPIGIFGPESLPLLLA